MSHLSFFQKNYQKLNPEQKKAVDLIDGPVMAVAGPGTGKTQILALRVVNILRQTDTLPSNILCLTFTESAKDNLRQRLVSFLGRDGYKVKIHTFHSLSVEIISEYPDYFFAAADFKPLDELNQLEILDHILEKLDYDNPLRKYHPKDGWTYSKAIISRIKELKENFITPSDLERILAINQPQIQAINRLFLTFLNSPEFPKKLSKKNLSILNHLIPFLEQETPDLKPAEQEFLNSKNLKSYAQTFLEKLRPAIQKTQVNQKTSYFSDFKKAYLKKNNFDQLNLKNYLDLEKTQALAGIYQSYQEALYQNLYYDFQDMILQVLQAIKNNPDLKFNLQENCHHLLIDEFQDTNLAQLELAESLLNIEISEGNPNIFIVGDDDQSIYKFQGANLDNLLGFKQKYQQVQSVFLTKNYRSKQEILDLAQKIINQSQTRLSVSLQVDKNLQAMT